MQTGYFYFISDEFFDALPGCGLMFNKNGERHARPCYYCFQVDDYYWMVPISSKIEKYRTIHDRIEKERGSCDTIIFGYVNGRRSAFLVQNAFPVSEEYIVEQYFVEKGTVPVTVNKKTAKALNAAVRKVIRLYKRGIRVTLTDIDRIVEFLERGQSCPEDNPSAPDAPVGL